MTIHAVQTNRPTGSTLYAFPSNVTLANWVASRVALTEASSPNLGKYTGSLNDAIDTLWFLFSGATQPTAWSESVEYFDLDAATAANLAIVAGYLDTEIAAILSDTNAILLDTSEIGAAGAGLTNINLPNQTMDIVGNITGNVSGSVGSVTGLTAANLDATISSRATPAQVNTEVLDVLNVDTFAELSAPPAATSSLRGKLTWLFMWARNKSTQTSTQRRLYADDGTTVVATETVSDDATTYTKGEAS